MGLSSSDINNSLQNSDKCLFVPELRGGSRCMLSNYLPVLGSGSFAVVFKYRLKDGSVKAIRVWTKDKSVIDSIIRSSKEVSDELEKLNSKYFAKYRFYDNALLVNGGKHPILVMDWCDGKGLKNYVESKLGDQTALKHLADQFLHMFKYLNNNNISHGDLQHGNIMVSDKGDINLLDYDSLYFPTPFFRNMRQIISGYDAYQHPRRKYNTFENEKVDYFSQLIIYLSIVSLIFDSSLWNQFQVMSHDTRFLFSENDYLDLKNSSVYKHLRQLPSPVPNLLSVLESYLKENDIQKLRPFYECCNVDYFIDECSYVYCVNCGKKASSKDNFCIHCGTKLFVNYP